MEMFDGALLIPTAVALLHLATLESTLSLLQSCHGFSKHLQY